MTATLPAAEPSLGAQTTRVIDLRLAVPTLVAWVVAAVVIGLPRLPNLTAPSVFVAACIILAVALLVNSRSRTVLVIVALCAAASSLIIGVVSMSADSRFSPSLDEAVEHSSRVTVTAVVMGAGRGGRGFAAEVRTVDDPADAGTRSRPAEGSGSGLAVPVGVLSGSAGFDRVGSAGDAELSVPDIGTVVSFTATVAANERGDSQAYRLFPDGDVEQLRAPGHLVGGAAELRRGLRLLAEELPGRGGELLPGLAIGDTTQVSAELDGDMKASSLSHLTAVSGANCAVVVGLVLALGGLVRWPRGVRIAVAVTALGGFVVLVTPEPSVLRASVMALALLFVRLRGGVAAGVPVLALAVLVLLVHDPWLARNYGFVLSVCATAGLLVLAGPIAAALSTKIPRPLAALVAVPLAAQLACQPVLILLQPSIPLWGVVANILAGPAAPLATMLGLAACLCAPAIPWLAGALLWLAWLPSSWIAGVASFFASAPGAQLEWIPGAAGAVTAAAITTLMLLAGLGRSRRLRAVAAFAVCGCLVTLGAVALGRSMGEVRGLPRNWQYAACDVGQGDAFLVRSADAVALIDTGVEPDALADCLDDFSISRIDLLVLTHFDADHVGGSPAVLGRVDTVLVGPSGSPDDDELVAEFARNGANVIAGARGTAGTLGGLTWQVLWPPPVLSGFDPGNDASVVLAFEAGAECREQCLSGLFLGDLGEEAQSRLHSLNRAQLAALAPVDVLKVAHHGSADFSESLYGRLAPRVALIGVGAQNRYGHPTDHAIGTLERGGAEVFRTDQRGAIALASLEGAGRGSEVTLWTQRRPSG